jgi:hypothetical protein
MSVTATDAAQSRVQEPDPDMSELSCLDERPARLHGWWCYAEALAARDGDDPNERAWE